MIDRGPIVNEIWSVIFHVFTVERRQWISCNIFVQQNVHIFVASRPSIRELLEPKL